LTAEADEAGAREAIVVTAEPMICTASAVGVGVMIMQPGIAVQATKTN
jgi:hypothetical protein